MRPILFSLDLGFGPMGVPGYGFFIMVGWLAAGIVARAEAKRSLLPAADALDAGFVAIGVFLIGGRVGYALTSDLAITLRDPLHVFEYWTGGFVLYGGAIAISLAIWAYASLRGVPFQRLADVLGVCATMGVVFGRLGCFSAGCCYGRPIDQPFGFELPWGVRFFGGSVPLHLQGISLHPTQLYSSLSWVLIFLILQWLRRWQRFDGQAFGWMLLLYSIDRFLLEFLRGDAIRGVWDLGLSSSQIIGLPIFVIGCALLHRWRAKAVREGLYGLTAREAALERMKRGGEILAAQDRTLVQA